MRRDCLPVKDGFVARKREREHLINGATVRAVAFLSARVETCAGHLILTIERRAPSVGGCTTGPGRHCRISQELISGV